MNVADSNQIDVQSNDILPERNQEEFEEEEEDEEAEDLNCPASIYKLVIGNGKLEFPLECVIPQLPLPASKLNSNLVFVVDLGFKCFIWIGKEVDEIASKNGMIIAHHYLQGTSHPLIPACIVREGNEPKIFKRIVVD